jgi:hypothetical protein
MRPLADVSLYKFIADHSRERRDARTRLNIRNRELAMNLANLPFDSEAMLQGLRGWVECESPTWDAGAVERMLDIAARDMAIMGATIERIAGRQGFGGCVRARFPHPRQGEPGILIAGISIRFIPSARWKNSNGGATATNVSGPGSST